MADEQDKDKLALVKYEPQPLTVVERLELYSERKRQDLETALAERRVGDPFTVAGVVITWQAIALSAAASIAASLATMAITSALTPKQRLFEERGRRTGDLVLNSELGILIPEVYFGMLSDGYGGSWVPAIIGWTSGIRKHVSTTTTPNGGGKFGGGGGTTETREISYDLDWLLIWANKGPYRVLRSKANSDVIFDLYGQVSSYEGEAASSYGAPFVLSDFDHASGGKEVTLQNEGAGNGGSVQWNTVQSNGAATRQLTIYYRTSSNTVPLRVNINGGANQDFTVAASNEVYLAHTIPVALNDGANTVKIQNRSTTFNIGIDKIYLFPGHGAPTSTTGGTGVFDPVPGPDPTYDPELPPGPGSPYEVPFERWSGVPVMDGTGAQSGSMNIMGSAADFAIYPGNTSQLPDPTYEAAIDAQFGAGSTPAYRGRCYEVDANFYLTRWGGVVPNRIALLEHETIKNLSQMCGFMCTRVGIESTDYDFSDIETITPRGLRIMGTKFEAREPMTSAENIYDVIFTEQEGQLKGLRKSALTSVATLTDEDFAWSDEEESTDGPVSVIDVIEANETDLPRRVDVKYVDLDRDGEPGLQGYARQVTEGEESITLDLQWTLTREEAQALAQKEVYRSHIEKPCRYVLSWEHLWINVGDMFTATLSDGFTYSILHVKDSGGIGIRGCEGLILDEPIFDQSAVVDPYGYEQPVVPIPAMTITMLLDTPLLRDGDETNNNGVGFYAVGTPRTSDTSQAWGGYGLYIQRNGEWYLISDSTLPGTIGKVVSAVGLGGGPTEIDNTGVITVDLYGTTTLSSVTEADVLNGANPALIGDMVFGFATATKLGGFPNRWELSDLRNGLKGTDAHITDTFTDKRFVFLDGAVKFVPLMIEDLNVERNYAAVTAGQSLDDAAVIPFTWTGNTLKPAKISNLLVTLDASSDYFIQFLLNSKIDPREGVVEIWSIDGITKKNTLYAVEARGVAIPLFGAGTTPLYGDVYDPDDPIPPVVISSPYADQNNLIAPESGTGWVKSLLAIDATGIRIDVTTDVPRTAGGVEIVDDDFFNVFGLLPADLDGTDPGLANVPFQIQWFAPDSPSDPETKFIWVFNYTTKVFELITTGMGSKANVRAGETFSLMLSGSECRAYRNYTEGSKPLAIMNLTPSMFPLRLFAGASQGSDMLNFTIRGITASVVYSARQQIEDFGSVQDPIRLKVYQKSRYAAEGITGVITDYTTP